MKPAWSNSPDAVAERLEVHLGQFEADYRIATEEEWQRYGSEQSDARVGTVGVKKQLRSKLECLVEAL
ncbi:hypothetical protein RRF57_000156 [Xylaria bambusicola]|uniref:Uncharacterized protein n=1 Tax=Xylaria bambusicola TaxID=326684 RepID=A0AAN7YTX5_9PEZI